MEFDYDAKNRLVKYRFGGAGSWYEIKYDALGRVRSRVDLTPTTTKYYSDGRQLIQQLNDSNTVQFDYLRGPTGLDRQWNESNDSRRLYIKDNLGTVWAIVNPSDLSVKRYNYNAWGEHLDKDDTDFPTDTNNMRYIGCRVEAFGKGSTAQRDALYHFDNRHYAAMLLIYLTREAMLMRQLPIISLGMNPYSYSHNAPSIYFDPSGMLDTGIRGCMRGNPNYSFKMWQFFYVDGWDIGWNCDASHPNKYYGALKYYVETKEGGGKVIQEGVLDCVPPCEFLERFDAGYGEKGKDPFITMSPDLCCAILDKCSEVCTQQKKAQNTWESKYELSIHLIELFKFIVFIGYTQKFIPWDGQWVNTWHNFMTWIEGNPWMCREWTATFSQFINSGVDNIMPPSKWWIADEVVTPGHSYLHLRTINHSCLNKIHFKVDFWKEGGSAFQKVIDYLDWPNWPVEWALDVLLYLVKKELGDI